MEFTRPAEIERESMRIIDAELAGRGVVLPEEMKTVVRRVIHTTADFDYAENLRFTKDAVPRALAALRGGATIVTDTNMALAGVSKPALRKLGGEALCHMAEPSVAEEAKARGVTRAVVSMDHAAERTPDAVFAVGNAPTALLRLAEHIEDGLRPALVVGVPVGFVNVVESKERALAICERHGVPAIVALGRKGGSNVAAAIVNALLYAAAELTEPEKRNG
ncbi:MAG: precorrin-8X methylmutase [Ruminococcaceae bacterium]|nr:precorrin-8X methylmutase [Oscillospiraceae bacterium]